MTKTWNAVGAIVSISTAWLLVADVRRASGQADDDYPTLDLVLSGGAVVPSQSDDGLASIGPTFGAAALIGLVDEFALGLGADYTTLSWSRSFEADEFSGSISHTAISALVRVTMVRTVNLQTYAQAGVGYGDLSATPDNESCSYEDGFTPQLALGLDLALSRGLRIGLMATGQISAWGRGCDGDGQRARPDTPYPGFLLGLRFGLTSTWDHR